MLKNIFFFLFFVCFGNANAQSFFDKFYEPEQLREDFDLLIRSLQEGQPTLFDYISEAEWKRETTYTADQLLRPMSEAEFYNLLKPMVAKIKDGNTAVIMSEDARYYVEENARIFPFEVRFWDNRTFIYRNYSENLEIQTGAELLSINGIKAEIILQKLLERESTDGNVRTAKNWRLEQNGYTLDLFTLYGEKREFEIEYVPHDVLEVKKTTVRAISYRLKASKQQENKELVDPENPFRLDFLDKDSLAIMTINVFGDFLDTRTKYLKFVEESFAALKKKKTSRLVLDLRDNSGGISSYAAFLYSFLNTKDFRYYEKQIIRQKKFFFEDNTDFEGLTREIGRLKKEEQPDGKWKVSVDGLDYVQQPSRNFYAGKLTVLVNGGTFGAASELAALIKASQRGTLVGEETGNVQNRSTTSTFVPYLILPNTQVMISIPLVVNVLAVPPSEPEGTGVMPHHVLKPKSEDLSKDKDVVLEYALKIARE